MDVAAAQLIFFQVLADTRHNGRPRNEELRGLAHHHGVMAGGHARGAQARHRTQGQRHDRYGGQVLRHQGPHAQLGQQGVALDFDIAHRTATARAVHQPQERQAQVVRHAFGLDQLVADRAVVGAATHGEIIGGHHHRPPLHLGAANQQV
ncbi:hypothetical protein D3C78_1425870 [compost metagenome]